MNKMKNKLFMLLCLLMIILPVKVNALAGSVSITCNKSNVIVGDTIDCTLKGTVTEDTVSGVTAKVKLSDNLTLTSITNDSAWQGEEDGGNIDLYTSNFKSGTFNIATFSVKVGNNATNNVNEFISIDGVLFSSGTNFNTTEISGDSKNFKILSTDNNLKSLTVDNGTLTPNFSKDVTNYTLSINAPKVTVSAAANNSAAIVNGTGSINLDYGANAVKINVKSEAGTTKVYTLTITRIDNRSTDNTLNSLKLNNNEIELKNDVLEYKYSVLEDVDSLIIDATLNDEKSDFVEGYEPKTVSLKTGENTFEIKVIAENESIKTYKLIVTRPEKKVVATDKQNSDKGNKVDNPKTGSSYIYIVILLLIISVGVGMFFFQKSYETGGQNE